MNLVQISKIRSQKAPLREASNEQFQTILDELSAGCGYVPADGSEHTCGDVNGSGLQCLLYRKKKQQCVILGPNYQITPSMTCIYDITGPELPASTPALPLSRPSTVGLVETHEGATCKRCDALDKSRPRPACLWLTDLLRQMLSGRGYQPAGAVYWVEEGGCCNWWKNEKVQTLVD